MSTELAESIRGWIVGGDLGPGDHINEVRMAERLEVSRTPLREALSTLAAEGLVEVRARHGFFVRELDATEVEELYQIRAILDPAALDLAGLPSQEAIDSLDELNARIAASSGSPNLTIELDDHWHLKLLEGCPNRFLIDLIRQYMRRKRALEHAYMGEQENVEVAVAEHARIIDALRAGDMPAAVEALRTNMRSAVGPLIERMEKEKS